MPSPALTQSGSTLAPHVAPDPFRVTGAHAKPRPDPLRVDARSARSNARRADPGQDAKKPARRIARPVSCSPYFAIAAAIKSPIATVPIAFDLSTAMSPVRWPASSTSFTAFSIALAASS